MKIFRDTGVAYLDSVENFEQICADFIHSISFKFFLNRKGALCAPQNIHWLRQTIYGTKYTTTPNHQPRQTIDRTKPSTSSVETGQRIQLVIIYICPSDSLFLHLFSYMSLLYINQQENDTVTQIFHETKIREIKS